MINYQNYGNSLIGKFWRICTNGVYQALERSPSQQLQSNPSKDQLASSQQSIRKKGKPSQSIIIGVILVAILLMIALFIRVIFFPEGFIEIGPTPTASMVWIEDPEELGNYTGYIVAIGGVSSLNTDDVTITVTHGYQSGSRDLDEFVGGPPLHLEGLTLDFNDQPPEGDLGPEDIFTIIGGNTGDIIRLVYQPTGGQMCSTTLS